MSNKQPGAKPVSNETNFSKNVNRTALSLAVAAALPGAAMAQSNNTDEVIEEIVTIGVRSSILGSIDAKRMGDTISDVIDAGALGSLPDQSIADALGRVPGVTTIRDSGQSSQLNIRGMNGDFIQTTLNGREQAATSGYAEISRWMSFDQYPSELITQAAVYKSPKASLLEGGVAATVELKTANPLDAPKDHNFVANVRLSQNDAADDIGADDSGERFSLSYQGKYLDDTFGVALGFSYLEQPNAFVFSRAGADNQLGYGERDIDGSTVSIPRAFQWQGGNGTDKRTGVLASFVFEPNDAVRAQLDYFNSDFDRGDQRQGITVGGIDQVDANTFVSGATVQNGVATSATISAIDPTLNNQDHPWFEARTEDQTTSAESESLGLNLEWYISDSSTLTFDVATSEGTKTREDRIASLHAYEFGDGGTTWQEAPGQAMTYSINGEGFASASFAGVDFTDINQIRLGRYERYPHRYTDEIDSWQIDFKQDVEWGAVTSIDVGMRSSDRTFGMDRGTALYGSRSGQVTGWCEDNTSEIACMPQSVDGFVRVQSLPGVPDHFVVTDLDALGVSIFGAGGFEGKDIYSRDWTFLEDGQINEEVDAFYVMANLDFEWGDVPVRGNIGVRYVQTDVKSIGLQNVGGGNGDSITDDVGVTNDFLKFNSYGPDYNDTLPSVNLSFELSDNDILRVAAASVIGRPPAGQLRGSAGSWFGPGTDYNVWTNGSPYLDPFRADQFDLSYEHYFEDGGAVTAAVFWKDIESLLEKLQYPAGSVDFGALGIELPLNPDTGEQTVPGVYETWRNNNLGGYIRGIELAATKTFDNLPDLWNGLGVTASYSFTESETEISGGSFYGQNLPLPGLSENVWSATVFYDYDRFATHVNVRYRDEFVQSLPVPGSSAPTLAQPYTTVDAQASYAFDNGFSVVFSVNNLTDEENTIEYGSPGLLGEYKQFGRQFYLGVNYQY